MKLSIWIILLSLITLNANAGVRYVKKDDYTIEKINTQVIESSNILDKDQLDEHISRIDKQIIELQQRIDSLTQEKASLLIIGIKEKKIDVGLDVV